MTLVLRVLTTLLLGIILSGCASPAVERPPTDDPLGLQIACGPPCPIEIDISDTRAWEPAVAVDPSDPSHIVVAYSIRSTDPTTGEFALWNHAAVTRDAGVTWKTTRIPGGPAEPLDHPLHSATLMGDAWVAILRDGTVLYSGSAETGLESQTYSVGTRRGYDLFVARSTDGGLTYPTVTIVASGEGAGTQHPLGGPPIPVGWRAHDKAAMTLGPDGTILLTWTEQSQFSTKTPLGGNCEILFSTSRDGVRWSEPKLIENGCFNGASPAITQDGVYAVAYFSLLADSELHVARSVDQGKSWTAAKIGGTVWMPTLRAGPMPGELALAYPESHGQHDNLEEPRLLTSRDGGLTWSPPIVFDRTSVGARTLPNVVFAPTGDLYFTHFSVVDNTTGEDARRDLRAHVIRNGSILSSSTIDQGIEGTAGSTGDYMGLDATRDGVFAAWVTRHGGSFDLVAAPLTHTMSLVAPTDRANP